MQRSSSAAVFAAPLLSALIACSDGVVAPPPTAAAPLIVPLIERESTALLLVTPSGGEYQLGRHAISIPAGSICDPRTSGYGPELWDAPCDPIRRPMLIRVSIADVDGFHVMRYAPQLRFVPTDDPARYVRLFMHTGAISLPQAADQLRIFYLAEPDGTPVDESLTDPTQRTFLDLERGLAYRRIKHFSAFAIRSGYMVGASVTGN